MRALLALIPLVAVACGSTESSSPGATHTGGAGGVAGATTGGGGGSPQFEDASTPPEQCPWPADATGGGGSDALCDGSTPNPAECSSQKPSPGSACTGSASCHYAVDAVSLVVSKCDSGAWSEVAHKCAEDCAALDAGAGVPVPGSCGSEQVDCVVDAANVTQLEYLEHTLGKVARCCGAVGELLMTVSFVDGCATSVSGAPSAIAQCVAKSLAGKRISCAQAQACALVVMTTLV